MSGSAIAKCIFCGRNADSVKAIGSVPPLVEGPGGLYICVVCIRLSNEVLDELEAAEFARVAKWAVEKRHKLGAKRKGVA